MFQLDLSRLVLGRLSSCCGVSTSTRRRAHIDASPTTTTTATTTRRSELVELLKTNDDASTFLLVTVALHFSDDVLRGPSNAWVDIDGEQLKLRKFLLTRVFTCLRLETDEPL